MPYQITITKIDTATKMKEGAWTTVDRRPWTDEELNEAAGAYGKSKDSLIEKEPLKEVRGYAPNRPAEETTSTVILTQTVEELDLASVIKAINNL